jgi:hypothetical protein
VSENRRARRKKRKINARNKGKLHREKKLESGKTTVEQLESGQVKTWRNGWIKDQSRRSQGESGKT